MQSQNNHGTCHTNRNTSINNQLRDSRAEMDLANNQIQNRRAHNEHRNIAQSFTRIGKITATKQLLADNSRVAIAPEYNNRVSVLTTSKH